MISDDEYLERIVAGFNSLSFPDADVQWNVKLNGRQFDVMVNFGSGPYQFLILIEVKDRSRKISANDIEAFVTKAKDKLANKIVFVSKSGYQKGALEVADRHGVELFEVSFEPGDANNMGERTFLSVSKSPDGKFVVNGLVNSVGPVELGEPIPVNKVEKCTLHYTEGFSKSLPTEPTQMEYYVRKTFFSDCQSIHDKISVPASAHYEKDSIKELNIAINPPLQITPPDSYFLITGMVRSIDLRVCSTIATPMSSAARFDPTIIAPNVEYKNAKTGKSLKANASSLPVGDDKLQIGKFYCSLFPLRYYCCSALEGEVMTLTLIECFQNGELLQARFTQKVKYSKFYVPVTDPSVIARLRARLKKYEDAIRKQN